VKLAPLPIDELLPQILEHFRAHPNLILQASPGSGKTTRVPPALLTLPELHDQEIWVLEPRRLAAKWAARRVADELGEEVGRTVGYQFRFESVGGKQTRLRFFTEGLLARKLLGNPRLDGVGLVILDEFHERHLAGDIVLGHLKRLQSEGSGVRILVMSATLDADRLAAHLGGPAGPCRVLALHAHAHPVEIRYAVQTPEPRDLADAVRRGVRELDEAPGDILVFLPGMAEIRRTEEKLRGATSREILILHGEMEREAQDHVMKRAPNAGPRVILSTNVAESSVTIDGVRAVLDSGLHKQSARSAWSGIPALRLRPISRASATQSN
jgi:ATP-dependent helicase HrpB